MKTMLYGIVSFLADVHERILSLNDAYEYYYSDKQLHFLVIGITGMLLLFIVHPIFSVLAKHGHTLVISWLYVFTVILVLTFAIEIGQGVTNTGHMDFRYRLRRSRLSFDVSGVRDPARTGTLHRIPFEKIEAAFDSC